MRIQIQPDFKVENCIKCGRRPEIDEHKGSWTLLCPNNGCDNKVTGKVLDFELWNKRNKKNL